MIEPITSRSNPKVKLARSLRQRKARTEGGLFLVEGIRHVGQALEAGAAVEFILFAPEQLTSPYAQGLVAETSRRGIPCLAVTNEAFESLAEKEHPQGILAVVRQPERSLADLQPESHPWLVGLVDPQDPGNVGAILRTLDAVGASGLALIASDQQSAVSGVVDPYHPTCVRASLGAIFWKPVILSTFREFAAWARENNYAMVGTSARAELDYTQVKGFPWPSVLLLGSEREGLSQEQLDQCDLLVRLPMHGRGSSLNLAVAAGVLLYDQLSKGSPSGGRKPPGTIIDLLI